MLVSKTVNGRIENPTKFKRQCLDFEYNGYQQWMIMGVDNGIYSTYKTVKHWKIKKIKYKEYPLIIWHKLTKIERRDTTIANYWILFRTKKKRGGIWLPLKLYQPIPKDAKLRDSFITYNHRKSWYEVRLVFAKEYKHNGYSNLLAIDLGERVMATVVCGSQERISKPYFYGKEIRGIRRHYSWLRKRLGERKLLKVIKRVGHKEQNKVDSLLHVISKEIVRLANQHQIGFIFLGNLKGLRESAKGKGKRMRRIAGNFTYFKLTQYITYKAQWSGISVIQLDESYSSKTCSRCGEFGKRVNQGLFRCSNCGYQINADYNGAKNILKRGMDYMSILGVSAYALNPFAEMGSTI